MENTKLNQEEINETLFIFLQSVYQFEKREVSLFSVSWDEVYLLQLLSRNSHMTVTEIANKLKVKKFTASRMITRLANKNLLLRKQSNEDRRLVKISISPQGLSKINEIEDFNYNTIIANIDTLGKNEVEILINSIKNLDVLLGLKE